MRANGEHGADREDEQRDDPEGGVGRRRDDLEEVRAQDLADTHPPLCDRRARVERDRVHEPSRRDHRRRESERYSAPGGVVRVRADAVEDEHRDTDVDQVERGVGEVLHH